ncbi:MAG: energy transducer TonB [Caulobacteraceae bacterium]
MFSDRAEKLPSYIVAVTLHVLVVWAAMLLAPKPPPPLPFGSSVPVSIVANSPTTDLRAALEAESEQAATTPDPVEVPPAPMAAPTPPTPTPPAPRPSPAPPQPKAAAPAPKAATPPGKTQPKTPTRPAPAPSFDLDQLAASVARDARASASGRSNAPKGPARPETAPQARPVQGNGLTAAENGIVGPRLEQIHRRPCEIRGGGNIPIVVNVEIDASGRVLSVTSPSSSDRRDPTPENIAAENAISSVRQAEQLGVFRLGRAAKFTYTFSPARNCG